MDAPAGDVPDSGIGIDLKRGDCRRYLFNLLISPCWIERRVVSIELIDGERSRKRVSADIDVRAVRTVAEKAGLTWHEQVAVPLGIIPKGLALDFSVTDHHGHPLPVMTSERSTLVWDGILLHLLEDERFCDKIGAEFSITPTETLKIIENIEKDIHKIVSPMNTADLLNVSPELLYEPTSYSFRQAVKDFLKDQLWMEDLPVSRNAVWDQLFKSNRFTTLLKCATLNYIPVVAVSASEERCIVKYNTQDIQRIQGTLTDRWLENRAKSRESEVTLRNQLPQLSLQGVNKFASRLWAFFSMWVLVCGIVQGLLGRLMQFLGFHSYILYLDTSLVSHAAREHSRIACPPGICITGLKYADSNEDFPGIVMSRVTRERAILYTKSNEAQFDPAQMRGFSVSIRPRMTGFNVPAFVVTLVAAALSWLSECRADRIADFDMSTTSAVTTILLLCASLSSLYVARPDEHRYRARMLVFPRSLVILSGMGTALIAVTAVFIGDAESIRLVANGSFWFSVATVSYLIILTLVNTVARSRVLSRTGKVTDYGRLRKHPQQG